MYTQIREPQYYMLVTSLPAFRRNMADHKELPITKLQLDDRLRFLLPKHRKMINTLVDLITKDSFDSDETYLENYKNTKSLIKECSSSVDPILTFFMDWRVITSALRASIKEEECPAWLQKNDYSLTSKIVDNWRDPYFDLQRDYPLILLLRESMKADNTIAVENMLLKHFWNFLSETAFDALFDLDAVATYVLRWYILRRWLRRDFDQALATVNQTIDNILEKTELSL